VLILGVTFLLIFLVTTHLAFLLWIGVITLVADQTHDVINYWSPW